MAADNAISSASNWVIPDSTNRLLGTDTAGGEHSRPDISVADESFEWDFWCVKHDHNKWQTKMKRSCHLQKVKSLFCLAKEENILFNDALNTFYLRLYGVTVIDKRVPFFSPSFCPFFCLFACKMIKRKCQQRSGQVRLFNVKIQSMLL